MLHADLLTAGVPLSLIEALSLEYQDQKVRVHVLGFYKEAVEPATKALIQDTVLAWMARFEAESKAQLYHLHTLNLESYQKAPHRPMVDLREALMGALHRHRATPLLLQTAPLEIKLSASARGIFLHDVRHPTMQDDLEEDLLLTGYRALEALDVAHLLQGVRLKMEISLSYISAHDRLRWML